MEQDSLMLINENSLLDEIQTFCNNKKLQIIPLPEFMGFGNGIILFPDNIKEIIAESARTYILGKNLLNQLNGVGYLKFEHTFLLNKKTKKMSKPIYLSGLALITNGEIFTISQKKILKKRFDKFMDAIGDTIKKRRR